MRRIQPVCDATHRGRGRTLDAYRPEPLYGVHCIRDRVVVFGERWRGGGSSCNAPVPVSPGQVYHFLLVSVNGSTVTVASVDSHGVVFDQHSYSF